MLYRGRLIDDGTFLADKALPKFDDSNLNYGYFLVGLTVKKYSIFISHFEYNGVKILLFGVLLITIILMIN